MDVSDEVGSYTKGEASKNSSTSNDDRKKKNVIVLRNDPETSLIEVLPSRNNCDRNEFDDKNKEPFLEALCLHVEPRACSGIVRQLSSLLPLEEDLAHLKRVRKRPKSPSEISSSKATESNCSVENPQIELLGTDPLLSVPIASEFPLSHRADTVELRNPQKKRRKKGKQASKDENYVLEVLLATPSRLLQEMKKEQECQFSERVSLVRNLSLEDHPIVRQLGCGPLHCVMVPRYEPRSETEWKKHNQVWPTHYYPLKFDEHKAKESSLSPKDLDETITLMERCIRTRSVLIVDPNGCREPASNDFSLSIVADSETEEANQIESSTQPILALNPLATPILLALQGVSRAERKASVDIVSCSRVGRSPNPGNVPDPDTDTLTTELPAYRRQYICTGYDLYSFYEPNVFEAMACLHSRLRRLVYFVPTASAGNNPVLDGDGTSPTAPSYTYDWKSITPWSHGISKHCVHHLPGTNHNYRAFEYRRCFFDN